MNAVFYIQAGKGKLPVLSEQGKEAVIAMLEPGSFFGKGCGQLACMVTATAMGTPFLSALTNRR